MTCSLQKKIDETQKKFNMIDKKRPKGKKTTDPVKGQVSLGFYIGDEKRKK